MNITRFCLVLVALATTLGCSEKPAEVLDTRPLVRVGAVTNGVSFADEIAVQGVVRTKNSAKISARVPGTIDTVYVAEGQLVKKGTPLFQVDRVNLENAVKAAEDDCALASAKLAQAEAQLSKVSLDAARQQRLVAVGAVTKDQAERAEVGLKTATAAFQASKAAVTKAQTGLEVARKNLSDSKICAPFDGIISEKLKDVGDFAAPGSSVFAMDDPSCYEVSVSLNAALYGRVEVGKTELEGVGPITYKSPRVNPATRTFEVRATLHKTPDIAIGMIRDTAVVFSRVSSAALPAGAVALREGENVVFKVVDGKIVRVPVKTGLSAHGFVAILEPTFAPDDAIVTEGMLLVNAGDEVRVLK